jgi:hypothetical protein
MKRTLLLLFALWVLVACSAYSVPAGATDTGLNISMVNQNPDPASAGDIVELRFMVQNSGGSSAKTVQFTLLPEYPFSAVPGETYTSTSTLSPYQSGSDASIIKFKIRVDNDAVGGQNPIKLVSSEAGLDISLTSTFYVSVTGSEFAQISYIDKSQLTPGKESNITFTVTNVGGSSLRNMVFSWTEENGVVLPLNSDNTKYVKCLGIGQSVNMQYTIVADVNANPGLYKLALTTTYYDDTGISHTMETTTGIFIGGETDFDVSFSESTAGQTSLSVANIGNNPAMSVTVRVPQQDSYSVSGSTSSIIGNLERGDYTMVSFQIAQAGPFRDMTQDVAGRAPYGSGRLFGQVRQNFTNRAVNLSQDLKVIIDYTDTTGLRHSVQKTVSIQFRQSNTTAGAMFMRQRPDDSYGFILPAVIAAALAIAGFWVFKRRKKARKILASQGKRG